MIPFGEDFCSFLCLGIFFLACFLLKSLKILEVDTRTSFLLLFCHLGILLGYSLHVYGYKKDKKPELDLYWFSVSHFWLDFL